MCHRAGPRSRHGGQSMTGQVSTRRRLVAAVVAGVIAAGAPVLSGMTSAYASDPTRSVNAVIVWDQNAQTAIWDYAQQQPQVQARSFAMVHGAVYDAVNAI